MDLIFKTTAESELKYWVKLNQRQILNKLNKLFKELSDHPETGTGKPKQLTGDLSGYWSRRINQEHRPLYKIEYPD